MVNLSGLKTVSNTPVSPDPSLVTTPPFTPSTAAASTAAKTSCVDIVAQAKQINITEFLNNYAINDKASASSADLSIKDRLTTFRTALSSSDTSQPIVDKPGFSDIDLFLANLKSTHLPVLRLVDNCLKEDQQIDMTEYNSAKATNEESKSRLESILTPEQHISYYEGWFPIVRPMTEMALFLLFGTGLFLLLVSITVFLSMSGVAVQIQIPELLLPQMFAFLSYYFPPGSSYYLYAGLFFGLIATGLAFRFKYI
jgi:hypothetical protein